MSNSVEQTVSLRDLGDNRMTRSHAPNPARKLIVYATGCFGACLRTQTNSLRYNAAQARVSGRKLTVCATGGSDDSGPGRKLTVCVTGGSDDSVPGRKLTVCATTLRRFGSRTKLRRALWDSLQTLGSAGAPGSDRSLPV